MKVTLRNELLLINILTIVLIVVATFVPSNIPRIILGLPILLFFPGYTLLAALFTKKGGLGDIQRVALSFGLSVAVVPLLGLLLNYTPWGIRLYPVLISLVIFIAATSITAWYRRRGLAEDERFTPSVTLNLAAWGRQTIVSKALSVVLIVAIAAAIGTLGYAIATPKVGERFTEFYVLGPEGKAIDYPTELHVGEGGRVIVGIINREHEVVSYWVEVTIGGVSNNQLGPVELAHDKKWETTVSITPQTVGEDQKVEFILYKNDESEPYLKLHLWVDVVELESQFRHLRLCSSSHFSVAS